MKKNSVVILIFSLFWFIYGIVGLAGNVGLFHTNQIVYRYDTVSEYVTEQEALAIRGYLATLSVKNEIPNFIWFEEKNKYLMYSFVTEELLEIPQNIKLAMIGQEVPMPGIRIWACAVVAVFFWGIIISGCFLFGCFKDKETVENVQCNLTVPHGCSICPEKESCNKYSEYQAEQKKKEETKHGTD